MTELTPLLHDGSDGEDHLAADPGHNSNLRERAMK